MSSSPLLVKEWITFAPLCWDYFPFPRQWVQQDKVQFLILHLFPFGVVQYKWQFSSQRMQISVTLKNILLYCAFQQEVSHFPSSLFSSVLLFSVLRSVCIGKLNVYLQFSYFLSTQKEIFGNSASVSSWPERSLLRKLLKNFVGLKFNQEIMFSLTKK